jgi:8-oxo-dGTP pyrophosphatase MutT (NUDIX family)
MGDVDQLELDTLSWVHWFNEDRLHSHCRVAAAALVNSDRVLLSHRHPSRRWYPNVWDIPGGHIEDDETSTGLEGT